MAIRSQSFSKTSPIEISKSPPASKNLAHVPCKFFKQGACQAGASCPFSHTLDTTNDTAPCKYFQKGNCKFGVKCALAHILPDGRRVNPKTLAQVYQNHNVTNGGSNGYSNGQGGNSNHNHNNNTNGGSNGNGNGNLGYFNPNHSPTINGNHGNLALNTSPSASYSNQFASMTSPTSNISGSPFNQYVNTQTSPTFVNATNASLSQSFTYETTTHQRTPSTHERSSFSFSTNSIWTPTSPNMITQPISSGSEAQNRSFYQRSVSHSSTFKQFNPSLYQGNSLNIALNESAIADDDEDDEDDQMLQEDFVPSSLSDLLTPQELQRRGSRSSNSRPSTSNFISYLGKNIGYNNEVTSNGNNNNGIHNNTFGHSHHSSTEAIIDPVDENEMNEMQFKMDEEDFYNDVIKNVSSTNGISSRLNGLTL